MKNLEKRVIKDEKGKGPIQIGENNKKYYGKYVAFVLSNPKRIIAYGTTPLKAYKMAEKKGVKELFVTYFPHPDAIFVYNAA